MIGNSANLSSHVRVEVKPSHKQVHVFHIILPKSNNGKPKFWMGLSKKIIWFKNCLDQKTYMSKWFYMGKKSGLKKFWFQIAFGSKKFVSKKIWSLKKISCLKTNWIQRYFGSKEILVQQTFLVQNKILAKKCLA